MGKSLFGLLTFKSCFPLAPGINIYGSRPFHPTEIAYVTKNGEEIPLFLNPKWGENKLLIEFSVIESAQSRMDFISSEVGKEVDNAHQTGTKML